MKSCTCFCNVFSDIVIAKRISVKQRQVMKDFFHLENKKITVMGLGLNRGGLGVTRFLAQSGAKVLVTDLKTKHELQETMDELKGYDIQYVLGEHRIEDFSDSDMIIQNPAVPRDSKYLQIARANGIPIETDLSLFLKMCPAKNLIAVGGTKGKTTVTGLIYHIFHHAQKDIVHAGNIGISVFDVLPDIKPETFVLLEISSWQLEGLRHIQFKPRIAVLTNILPDHLDRYSSFDDYAQSEKLICQYQNQSDYLITNQDNPLTNKIESDTSANIFWFSSIRKVSRGSFLHQDHLIFQWADRSEVFSQRNDIQIPGVHNIENILAAATVCFISGLPSEHISEGIRTFPGTPNRLEKIHTLKGIEFYNDTCATTPDASIAAIQSFPGKPLILILGGKDKKLHYEILCQTIKESKNIVYLLILQHPEYDATHIILKQLERFNLQDRFQTCHSMPEAVRIAYSKATPGTVVLLSPAAASFGMYRNEFERGKSFSQSVKKLTCHNDQQYVD